MAIIRQNEWQPPVTTTFGTIQDLGENPHRAYREILMAADDDGNPVPYQATPGLLIRIPHGLSLDTSTAQARIPDVVIPVPVANLSDLAAYMPHGPIAPIWAPTSVVPLTNGPSTGMWMDESYVYLFVGGTVDEGNEETAFVVYVEYTHSVITNEIVTGAYEYIGQLVEPPPF